MKANRTFSTLALALACAAVTSPPTICAQTTPQSADTHIYASMSFSDRWGIDGGSRFGIYELPAEGTPQYFTQVFLSNELRPAGGSVYFKGQFLNIVPFEIDDDVVAWTDFLFFNSTDWTVDSQYRIENRNFLATDMAYDATTDTIYGCFYDFETGRYFFGTFDPATGDTHSIAEIETYGEIYKALSFDAMGQCYAITRAGVFCEVNKQNGEAYTVAETTLNAQSYLLTGAIDPRTDLFYYFFGTDDENALYTIDLETGKTEKLYDMPDNQNWTGMYITGPDAPENTPAAPAALQLEFDGNSLEGSVSFTLPATLMDGTPASGELSYTLLINGVEETTGQGTCGSTQKINLKFDESAKYTATVAAYNTAGRGGVATATRWLGNDTPAPVTDVVLSHADGLFTLTWSEAQAAHGGYINPSEITYTVTRYPDGITTEGVSGCTFSQEIANPGAITGYTYEVVANFAGKSSAPATSNICYIGAMTPPFAEDFETSDCFDALTVIDANNDGETWRWYSTSAIIWYSDAQKDHDDWLILPGMYFETGKKYDLAFDRSVLQTATETFEVKLGTAPTASAMTATVVEPTDINNTAYTQTHAQISVPESGVYYIGFHAISDFSRCYAMFLDNIELSCDASGITDTVDRGQTIEVTGLQGAVAISNAQGLPVAVYTTDGKLAASTTAAGALTQLTLQPGLYIVKAGDTTAKVAVK